MSVEYTPLSQEASERKAGLHHALLVTSPVRVPSDTQHSQQLRAVRRVSGVIWVGSVAGFAFWFALRDGITLGQSEGWLPFTIHLVLVAVLGLVIREWFALRWEALYGPLMPDAEYRDPSPHTPTPISIRAPTASPKKLTARQQSRYPCETLAG